MVGRSRLADLPFSFCSIRKDEELNVSKLVSVVHELPNVEYRGSRDRNARLLHRLASRAGEDR